MDFGKAIDALKQGQKISRTGWNGKEMYVRLVNPVHTGIETLNVNTIDEKPMRPFIVMKTVDDMWVPWLAAQSDILAEDWQIVE